MCIYISRQGLNRFVFCKFYLVGFIATSFTWGELDSVMGSRQLKAAAAPRGQ